MLTRRSFIFATCAALLLVGCSVFPLSGTGPLAAPYGLTVEYRTNPVGIDTPAPRFSWKLATTDKAAKGLVQTAYRIRVASSLKVLESGKADLWDSGRVKSDRQLNIVYAGRPLASSQRAWWTVRVWANAGGPSPWSEPAHWIQGIMDSGDWHAKWIGANEKTFFATTNGPEELVSPAFQKTFTTGSKPVAVATLHIAGLGFYEASLNGRRIGDKVLDPSPTCYDKRVLYSTYDLTDAVRAGTNTLKVLLGHGWFDVRTPDEWGFDKAPWRASPRMIAQLEIVYADGTRDEVVSDTSWRQVPNPTGYDCIREGAVIGKNHAAAPDLDKVALLARGVTGPKGRLVAESQPGAVVARTVSPVSIKAVRKGVWIADFGENIAGWAHLEVRGQKVGDVVTIRYGERLDAAGALAIRPLDCFFRTAASSAVLPGGWFHTDRMVCSGAPVEVYEPRFTYYGFQYVEISGLSAAPAAGTLCACLVRTDFRDAGSFTCSNELLNRLQRAACTSYRNNFTDGVPTDCPQREKNGWTGDASLASEMAMFNFDNVAGYEKWVGDLVDAQSPDGGLPGIVPSSGWGYKIMEPLKIYGPAWDSALFVVPWMLYIYRGDTRALETAYPAMVRYLAFLEGFEMNGVIAAGLGDWCPARTKTEPAVTSTGYYVLAARIAARTAEVLGRPPREAEFHRGRAERVRAAFNRVFGKGNGVYDNESLTAQGCALHQDLVPSADVPDTRARLVDAVERASRHTDFGTLGAKYVFRALSDAGRTDLAYAMLTQKDFPSFGEWIARGATTLWESFPGDESRDHVMFGDFSAWLYQYLGGIRLGPSISAIAAAPVDTDAVAFKRFLIAPDPVKGLDWVKASHESPYGLIRSEWRQSGNGVFELEVTVPVNTEATVVLPPGAKAGPVPDGAAPVESPIPGRAAFRVGSGSYHFQAVLTSGIETVGRRS